MSDGTDLIISRLEPACRLLAEASDAPSAKRVADLARAAEVYARRQRLGEEAIAYATTVRIDAMTMLGEYLRAGPKNKGANGVVFTGSRMEPVKDDTPTLKDVGVSKRESADAQALAAIKESAPELHEKVKAGKMTVPQARRVVQREEKHQGLEAKAAAAPRGEDSSWRVVQGDCLAELPRLKAGSVRLVFADPPYNQGDDYGEGPQADLLPEEAYLSWCSRWIEACARVLSPDGSMWVLISEDYADHYGLALRAAGLRRRRWVVWYESFGVNCANNFGKCARHLFWCVKDPKRFVFHHGPVTRPSWRQRNGDPRADPSGRLWDSVWGLDPAIPRLVDNCAERVPGRPNQLPLALLRPVVGCASDPGDLVVDPFSGLGTTGAACVELGRRFVGIEKGAEAARLSRLRLKGVSPCT